MVATALPEALVIFEDRPDSRWLGWLKPGFRHCYCLVRAERGWILIDPLLQNLRVSWLDLPNDFDPVEHYIRSGRIVISGFGRDHHSTTGFVRLITCVEIVKRTLGLGHVRAWTPYQLHRFLLSNGWLRHSAH